MAAKLHWMNRRPGLEIAQWIAFLCCLWCLATSWFVTGLHNVQEHQAACWSNTAVRCAPPKLAPKQTAVVPSFVCVYCTAAWVVVVGKASQSSGASKNGLLSPKPPCMCVCVCANRPSTSLLSAGAVPGMYCLLLDCCVIQGKGNMLPQPAFWRSV